VTQQLIRTAHGVRDKGGGKKTIGQGPLAAIEAADTVALVGVVASSGALAATEINDSIAVVGSIGSIGALAAIESPDTFAGAGALAGVGCEGVLAAAETSDVAAFAGELAGVVIPPVFAGGGGYYPPPRPFPVTGYGFGILPRLAGEAHGVVGPATGEGSPTDDEILMLLLLAA
jgi:hypothetical protein